MKKIISTSLILSGLICFTNAFNASLSIDNPTKDINNPIVLNIKIESKENNNIIIKKIKGLDNFDIVGQNQMQSTSMNMVNINGKTKQEIITTYNVILKLLAKKEGNYTIGPAIIQIGNKEYKTNSVKVKIIGQKIMLNNSNSTINQLKNINKNDNINNTSNDNTNNDILKQFKEEKIKIEDTNYLIYYIPLLLLFLGFLTILWLFNKEKEKITKDYKEEEKVEYNKESKETNNKSTLSFLKKYGIENPETKTYTEITNYIKNNNITLTKEEEDIINKELLNKFKN